MIVINIFLAAIPSILIVLYVYRKDKQKKEPPRLVLATFILGFFAVLPALILELIVSEFGEKLTGTAYLLFRAFVIAAFVEEGVKLGVIRIFVYRKPAFDEVTDGILYAVTASLGFAFFENILYSFGPPALLIIRGLTAVPLHAAASGIMGYYLGFAKVKQENHILKGFLIAIAIHGLYDFLLFTRTMYGFLVIPLLIAAILYLRTLFRKAQKLDRQNGDSTSAGSFKLENS
ncbi:MAG: PrsW family intramembrane metalloprotease [Spirochaetales bacterium]|jgi:protease PrsW|nr:PrsW family intramembrane metalloprotease [Spirochaetales bacterium]